MYGDGQVLLDIKTDAGEFIYTLCIDRGDTRRVEIGNNLTFNNEVCGDIILPTSLAGELLCSEQRTDPIERIEIEFSETFSDDHLERLINIIKSKPPIFHERICKYLKLKRDEFTAHQLLKYIEIGDKECECCGETFMAIGTSFYSSVDGYDTCHRYICTPCLVDASKCCACSAYIHPESVRWSRYEDAYCSGCYDEVYCACGDCGDEISHEEAISVDDGEFDVCDGCYQEYHQAIKSYSYVPTYRYYHLKKGSLNHCPFDEFKIEHHKVCEPFYGIELEVESRGSGSRSNNDIARDIIREGDGILYCKNDGSLNDGFEIVTHPMTYDVFRGMNLDEMIFKHRGDIKSFHTNTCGVHIHISRRAFGSLHLHKFIAMIHEYKAFTHFIAQRTKASEYSRWARFDMNMPEKMKQGMAREYKERKAKPTDTLSYKRNIRGKYQTNIQYGEKYVAVNTEHSSTIEVRVFKGNLKEVSFRKNIEYVDSLYHFTKKSSLKELTVSNFLTYVRNESKRYKNLNEYFVENKDKLKRVSKFPKSSLESTINS